MYKHIKYQSFRPPLPRREHPPQTPSAPSPYREFHDLTPVNILFCSEIQTYLRWFYVVEYSNDDDDDDDMMMMMIMMAMMTTTMMTRTI